MGGICILAAGLLVGCALSPGSADVLAVTAVTLLFGAIGFLDDLLMLRENSFKGRQISCLSLRVILSALLKLVLAGESLTVNWYAKGFLVLSHFILQFRFCTRAKLQIC